MIDAALTAICFCLALSACGAARAESGLSLAQAISYAMQHAPSLAKARASEQVSELTRDNAEAKYYPSVDLTTSQGATSRQPPPEPPPRSALFGKASLALTETLYDNGQSALGLAAAEDNLAAARLTTLQSRDDVVLEVAKAYYALEQADILRQVRQEQRKILDTQFRQLQTLYHQGLKTKQDYLRLQTQVRKAEIDVISAENSRKAAEVTLRRTIGASPDDATMSFAPFSSSAATGKLAPFPAAAPSVEKTYAYRIAEATRRALGVDIELARRKNRPEFTLSSGLTYENPDYLNDTYDGDSVSWNVTLGITYNLWDAGTRRRDVDIAASKQRVEDEASRATMLQLEADIRTLMDTFARLRRTYDLNRDLMKLQEESVAQMQRDFREGKIAYLDLITGLGELQQARVDFYTDFIAVRQALAQYYYYEGTIYEALAAP